ncbi:MAG: winged helix DNA-binding domain-containing protein [Actinomycetaceae bacterium]
MTARLTPTQARRARLDAHLLTGSDLSPAEVVTRAVALQGQDLGAVLRAIAVRSRPGTTLDDVRAAFDSGLVVRSWPMRGTLFATTPAHLATILHFTAERIQRADMRRRDELGLTPEIVAHAQDLLLSALEERPRTRAELLELWDAEGVPTAAGRGYHLIAQFAIAGLAHWGSFASSGKEQLFTLSRSEAPADPDAALTDVVRSYVAARGPVTEADLSWWTKLPKTLVRAAAARATDIVEVDAGGTRSWLVGEPAERPASRVLLVPAFDEWILGYQDRSLVAGQAMQDALVPGRNGVFRPAVLVDGRVVGTWRLPAGRRTSAPEVDLVEEVPARDLRAVDRALEAWPHRD